MHATENPFQDMSENRKKNAIYSLILVLLILSVWWYRKSDEGETNKPFEDYTKVIFEGKTMGTTYQVKYLGPDGISYKEEVDSLLEKVNLSLSTYIPESEISQFNRGTILKYESPFFYPVLKRSKEIYKKTGGAFDPTVGPLVNAWGFGPSDSKHPDSAAIDSLLHLVNYDSIYFDSISVCKLIIGISLDFNAIAKGYGVDVVAGFLNEKGIKNMMVEIGGEVYCQGRNEDDKIWLIGIDNPIAESGGDRIKATVQLHDMALATSGNYRNYYVKDGVKYAHTISPETGHPVRHSLLSASVFAKDCMTADAYATAFMVMGLEKAKKVLEEEELDAYLIYSDNSGGIKTYITNGIASALSE